MDMLASLIGQVEEQIGLDSLVLGEMFYFFTVVVMWLIHAGFMMYEAGAARRKNIMSTAIKNILTIAVVTPTFYYFGWYIYGCFQHGGPARGACRSSCASGVPGFCGATAPWADQAGPNLADHISLVFFLAFLLFSWTTASIMSGALIERVRLSAYLLLSVLLGSAVWIMDAPGWSSGGWLVTNYGFHDSIASMVVHGVAGGASRSGRPHLISLRTRKIGEMPNRARAVAQGVQRSCASRRDGCCSSTTWSSLRSQPSSRRTIGGRDRRDAITKPHNTHMTLSGLMLIFTAGSTGSTLACLVITSTRPVPRLAQHLPQPDDARDDRHGHHDRLRRRVHGWLVREQGRPVLDTLRRPRASAGVISGHRVIGVSAGADVYHPSLAYLLSAFGGMLAVYVGGYIEKKLRVDDAVGAVAVHGFCGFLGVFLVGIFAGGFPTGVNNVPSSFGGQLIGIVLTFGFWLAFLTTHDAARIAGPIWLAVGAVVYVASRRAGREPLLAHAEAPVGDLLPEEPEGAPERFLVPLKMGEIGERCSRPRSSWPPSARRRST